jgi:hypothetical protein
MFSAKFQWRDLLPTCPPFAPMTYFVKGRSDVFGQIPVARLAPHLPPTCPLTYQDKNRLRELPSPPPLRSRKIRLGSIAPLPFANYC